MLSTRNINEILNETEESVFKNTYLAGIEQGLSEEEAVDLAKDAVFRWSQPIELAPSNDPVWYQ